MEKSSEKGGLGNRFAALTKHFQTMDKTPNFDVRTLCDPGASDLQAAEQCADIPTTYSSPRIPITIQEIAVRLKSFKKPRSRVPGDILPQLVTNYAMNLAQSLQGKFYRRHAL